MSSYFLAHREQRKRTNHSKGYEISGQLQFVSFSLLPVIILFLCQIRKIWNTLCGMGMKRHMGRDCILAMLNIYSHSVCHGSALYKLATDCFEEEF